MSTTCDFDEPTTGTAYTDVLTEIQDRATVLSTMDYGATSNIPDGAKGYDAGSNLFQVYDSGGSSWSTLDLSGHLGALCVRANNLSDLTSAVTARSNLGLGSLATASTINNANWSGTDLAVGNGGTGASTAADARTNLGLGSLAEANTINNANWSGTDLAVTNGGTGASTAGDARKNLGLGTLATLSSVNNSNWSGTDLAVANGGTGASTAADARTALGAAASGSNSDITAMTNCASISDNALMTIGTSNANALNFQTSGSSRWQLESNGTLRPLGNFDFGAAGTPCATIYSYGIQGAASADFTILGQSGRGISLTVDGSYQAFKIQGATGANYWQVFAMGADSTKVPGTNPVADWWEIRDASGNARFIPLYSA